MSPTPPASAPLPKKCLHCGGNTVRPRRRPGRTVHYRTIAALPLPADLMIPTCSRCRAEYLDADTAQRLEATLSALYVAGLRRRASEAIKTLRQHISQRRLELQIGLSQGYLSRLLADAGNPSPPLVLLLAQPARSLKPETAAALYADYSGRYAVATHRFSLRLAKSFWQWAVRCRHTAVNPWLNVDAVGRIKVGKQQLRPSEARRFADAAEQEALTGSRIAVAVLLCLCCGLRASEAIGLRRRDLDGHDLFVEGTKTARARRRVTLPDWLLPHLARLIADTLPEELLFPHRRQTLFNAVKRLCRTAGTPLTCPHGLRATWASAAVTGGATVEAVAATMGHSSTRVTLRHYVERDAVVNAQVTAFDRLLNRSASVPPG